MNRPERIPLRPDYSSVNRAPGRALLRTSIASFISFTNGCGAQSVAQDHWPRDSDTAILIKAVTEPATLTSSGWADSLAATSVADFIFNMGQASAGSTLLKQGLQLQFGNNAAILSPGLLSAAANAGFVREASPIPVRQLSVDGPLLDPKKFATIVPFTREVFQHSVPNIEAIVSAVLTESVGLSLDLALFDTAAGDETRPAGLRYNVAGLSPASSGAEALGKDVASLVAAVASVAGNAPIIFVAAPPQAAAMKLWRSPFPYEVLASGTLAAGTVLAVATNALVSAIDPLPRIDVSREAVLHMDTSPTALSVASTPNSVAAPLRSLYQTDAIGLRIILYVSWGLRNSGGLSWTESVTW
jgi:hypothetical protein